MASEQIGIKLSPDGTSQVTGGLGSVIGKLGDLDSASLKVSDAFKSLGVAALAAVGVASLASIKSMVTGYIDAAEALKDLSSKTGASVESLSAFQSIGKLTGTTVDTVATAMTRLAKNMAVATEDSKGTTQAIKALGLNFDSLRAMKPDEQLLTVAKAMAQFQDGSSKAAVAMTLFGKSGADLLPFLKDLAAEGQLNAKVTKEQADMADAYNDAITKSAERTDDLKRSLALGLLPTLIAVHDLTLDFGEAIRKYLSGSSKDAVGDVDGLKLVIRGLGTVFEAVIVLASDVAYVIKGIGKEIGGIVAQFSALGEGGGIFSAEGRDAWTRVGDEMRADAKKSREELEKFQTSILGTTDRILEQRDALKNHSLSSTENANEIERLGKLHGAAGTKVLDFKAAAEEADKALQEKLKAEAAAIKKGQEFIDTLDLQLAALNQQISAGRELTKTEEALLKVEQDLRSGKIKLTTAEEEAVKLKVQEIDNLKQQVEQQKASEKATLDAVKAKLKEYDALVQANDKLSEEIATQKAANETLETGIDNTAKLAVEKLKEAAATADRRAIIALERDDNDALAQQYRDQAEGLRKLAELKEQGIDLKAAKEAADEWKKTTDSIGHGLTDALFRAFESGKDFFSTLWSGIKNLFKTTVLTMMIKPVQTAMNGVVGGVMGVASGTAGATGADAMGQGYSLYNMGSAAYNFMNGGASSMGNVLAGAGNYAQAYSGMAYGTGFGTQQSAMLAAQDAGMGSMGASSWGAGASYLGYGAAGIGIGSALAGDKKLLGMSGTTISTVGAAAGGMYAGMTYGSSLGPWGALIGGIIGGLLGGAFGMGPKKIQEQGIEGSFSGGGAAGNSWASWKQKGGWFRSDKTGTDTADLTEGINAMLDAGAKAVYDNAQKYAEALGLPAKRLDEVATAFKVTIGNDEKTNVDAINKAFADYATALSESFSTILAPFQKAGETVAQTIDRLLVLTTLSESLNQLGGIFSTVASSSLAARENILSLAGGIDQLMAKAGQFVKDYYTVGEQAGLQARDTVALFKSLGIEGAGLTSREDFRKLVEAIDVSTEQGQQQLVALLNIAPSFAQLADYLKEQNKTLQEVADQAPRIATLEALIPASADEQQAGINNINAQVEISNTILTQINDGISSLQQSIEDGLAAIAANTQATTRVLDSWDDGGSIMTTASP